MKCPYAEPKDGYHCREGEFYERAFDNQKAEHWNHFGKCPHCETLGSRTSGHHNPFDPRGIDPTTIISDNYGPRLKKIPPKLSEAIDEAVDRALGEDERILQTRGLTRRQHIAREVKKAMIDHS